MSESDVRTRVLILVDTLAGGGAQEFLFHLLPALQSNGLAFSVASFHDGVFRDRLAARGIPVTVLLEPQRGFRTLPALIARIWREMSAARPDVVHVFLQGSFVLGTPLARLRGLPVLHTVVAHRRQMQWWYRLMLVLWQPLVAAYLSFHPSDLRAVGVRSASIKAVEVAPELRALLALTHQAEGLVPPYDLSQAFPVVLSVGRLESSKGHDRVLEAWPEVRRAFPRAQLFIVGDGEERAALEALAAQRGVASSIVFTGYRPDLEALLRRADVVLRTSRTEGVNFSTLQAMAAGCAVIGCVVGAEKEMVQDGVTGVLVPCEDPRVLAQAIVALAADRRRQRALGERARAAVRRYYDFERIADTYAHLYSAARNRAPLDKVPDLSYAMSRFRDMFSGTSER